MAKKYPYSGLQGPQRALVKELVDLAAGAGRRRDDVLRDLVTFGFLAMRSRWMNDAAAEAEYVEEVGNLRLPDSHEYLTGITRAFASLVTASDGTDQLGKAAGSLETLNGNLGQFFSPASVGELTAALAMPAESVNRRIQESGYVTVADPCCGDGALLLAAAAHLRRLGFEPTKCLWVEGTDVDKVTARAAWLQLALNQIPGLVVWGNSLTLERHAQWATPWPIPGAARS